MADQGMNSAAKDLPKSGDWQLVGAGPALLQTRRVGQIGLIIGPDKPDISTDEFLEIGSREIATFAVQSTEMIWARSMGGTDTKIEYLPNPNTRVITIHDGSDETQGSVFDVPWDYIVEHATTNSLLKSIALALKASAAAAGTGTGSLPASGKAPVTGQMASATAKSNAFTPLAGRKFNVTVFGTFVGTLQLFKSFDNGTTWVATTKDGIVTNKFTSGFSEQLSEDEVGVQYRLQMVALTSGTLSYRFSQ